MYGCYKFKGKIIMKRFQKTALILFLQSVFFLSCFGIEKTGSFDQVINSIKSRFAPDQRTALFDIHSDQESGKLVLKGKTTVNEAYLALIDSLTKQNVQFVDSIEVLPNATLGDKIWGLATLSASIMRSDPDHAAEMLSQALMGTPLKVLEYEDGWYRVQTPDYYIGWMEGSGIERFTQTEIDDWKKSQRYVYNLINGNAFDSPERKSMVVTDLVLGDLFEVTAETKGYLKIKIPDGRTGYVKKTDCLSWNDWITQKPDVQTIISVARQMLGLPYMWGGTSSKAVDCSGLTKTSYFSQGIILARDASQQARYGQHPDFNNMDSLEAGDLLFFGRSAQRITHVGLYMGNGKYIHASGLVRINSIDPKDPAFNISERKNIVASSRILNSLNTEGIVLVKDHPWYSFQK